MRIPIRVIGIATIFFWTFLVLFFIYTVYSVKDVQFNIGDPSLGIHPNDGLLLSFPIAVDNRGYQNLGSFNVTTLISEVGGAEITRQSTFIPLIERGASVQTTHNVTISMDDLLDHSSDYLFNDTELMVQATFGMSLGEVIPIQASENTSLFWGAPLYSFRIESLEYVALNSTHVTVNVPISFENHAFFDLSGNIRVCIFNDSSILIGEGQETVDAAQGQAYTGTVPLEVSTHDLSRTGNLEVFFSNNLFTLGPLVTQYG